MAEPAATSTPAEADPLHQAITTALDRATAGLQWSDASYYLRTGVEILLLWVLCYVLLLSLSRISAGGKIKGLSLAVFAVVGLWLAARGLQLHAISWLLQAVVGFSVIIAAVVFQPELRRLFSRLGGMLPQSEASGGMRLVSKVVEALTWMSSKRIGALIVIERGDKLDDYIASGPLDCELTVKALVALFWKDSPLHDGAVVLRSGRIAGAGVILPLTANPAHRELGGTRHRAAIGISEDTDALALVVSEETGAISVVDKGEIRRSLTRAELEDLLGRAFRGDRTGTFQRRRTA